MHVMLILWWCHNTFVRREYRLRPEARGLYYRSQVAHDAQERVIRWTVEYARQNVHGRQQPRSTAARTVIRCAQKTERIAKDPLWLDSVKDEQ